MVFISIFIFTSCSFLSKKVIDFRLLSSKSFTSEDLKKEVIARASKVEEFEFIAEQAKRLGVKAYLFGGTASAYAHYVNWDLKSLAINK